eukprot:scaffold23522_cov79-Isochrysis_galbana.AAC.2
MRRREAGLVGCGRAGVELEIERRERGQRCVGRAGLGRVEGAAVGEFQGAVPFFRPQDCDAD